MTSRTPRLVPMANSPTRSEFSSVWVYCQNKGMEDHSQLLALTEHGRWGGSLVMLDNLGRESHAYLQHITRHYHDLAQHTLFSQDMPNSDYLLRRFQVSGSPSHVVLREGWVPSLVAHDVE